MPTPPDGYKAIGHVVTNSPDKPSLDGCLISCHILLFSKNMCRVQGHIELNSWFHFPLSFFKNSNTPICFPFFYLCFLCCWNGGLLCSSFWDFLLFNYIHYWYYERDRHSSCLRELRHKSLSLSCTHMCMCADTQTFVN